MSEKREAELKRRFTRELQRRLPHYLVLLQATAGAPDRGIAGDGRVTFWEFKHGTPSFESPGNQELMCMRLAEACHCQYVIWREDRLGAHQQTLIVTPAQLHRHEGNPWALPYVARCDGYNMLWLVEQVRKAHTI